MVDATGRVQNEFRVFQHGSSMHVRCGVAGCMRPECNMHPLLLEPKYTNIASLRTPKEGTQMYPFACTHIVSKGGARNAPASTARICEQAVCQNSRCWECIT